MGLCFRAFNPIIRSSKFLLCSYWRSVLETYIFEQAKVIDQMKRLRKIDKTIYADLKMNGTASYRIRLSVKGRGSFGLARIWIIESCCKYLSKVRSNQWTQTNLTCNLKILTKFPRLLLTIPQLLQSIVFYKLGRNIELLVCHAFKENFSLPI